MRINGMRYSPAIFSGMKYLPLIEASADPPRTVKSSPIDHHRAAVDGAAAEHAVGRHEIGHDRAGIVVGRFAGDGADFEEGAGIKALVDAFADRQAAAGMLAGDALGAAHLAGYPFAFGEFIQFRLPTIRPNTSGWRRGDLIHLRVLFVPNVSTGCSHWPMRGSNAYARIAVPRCRAGGAVGPDLR